MFWISWRHDERLCMQSGSGFWGEASNDPETNVNSENYCSYAANEVYTDST